MFRRRHPISLWRRLRGWLWPHMSWRRLGSYLVKRLTRLPGTPHSIAAGFACGTAISFTPFLGLHALLTILLCFLVRGNYLAGMAGTLVGNPWTFPFIWVANAQLGHFLFGSPLPDLARLQQLEFRTLFDELGAWIWPLTAGGVPLGALAGLAVYLPILRMTSAYQTARRHRREHRQAERRRVNLAAPGAAPDTSLP